jgi:Hypothetical glycosyl hydrolase family 15
MRTRVTLIAAVVTVTSALLSPALCHASVAGTFSLALDTPATIPNPEQAAQRNSYVVLQSWETQRAASLKAANPNLAVLAYQNLSAIAETAHSGGRSSSGVSYAEAGEHPEWFLRDTHGNRISEVNYPWLWMADVGNSGYQQRWTANVLAVLQSGPWDGVMMDDTNATAKFHVSPVSRIAAYPTNQAYQAAVGSMLAYAGPRIVAAGKLAIPNMGAWHEYPEVVEGWLSYVSGGMDQNFVKWFPTAGAGYAGPHVWRRQLEEVEATQRMGKRFLAVTHVETSEGEARRYGWATLLLGADGSAAYFATDDHAGEIWSSEYEASLGVPLAAASLEESGLWVRSFSKGLVVVNPTSSAHSAEFGGTYSGDGLTAAEVGTLQPHSALVLIRTEPEPAPEGDEPSADESAEAVPASGAQADDSPQVWNPSPGRHLRAMTRRCRRVMARRHLSKRRRARCARIVRAARHVPHRADPRGVRTPSTVWRGPPRRRR